MAIFGKSRKNRRKAKKAGKTDGLPGISPNPVTDLIMADIVMRGATRLARQLVEQKMLSRRYSKDAARKAVANRPLKETILAAAVARTATKSVPGAVLVGSGLLAKTFYDRTRKRREKIEGHKTLAKRIADAEK